MWQPSRQETKPYDRVTNLEADNGLRAVGKPCDHFKMENAVTHEETGGWRSTLGLFSPGILAALCLVTSTDVGIVGATVFGALLPVAGMFGYIFANWAVGCRH